MNCLNCRIEFNGRKDAKFCSPKCRVTFSRKQGIVTDNVTFSSPDVTDNFEFTVTYNRKPGDLGHDTVIEESHKEHRTAKYWYDVPLAAKPVIRKGWPEMPEYINGRQYFLWWQNEFATNDAGQPMLNNPFKVMV